MKPPLKAIVAKISKPDRVIWETIAQRGALFKRKDGRALLIFVGRTTDDLFSVGAVEALKGLADVLDNHGHKMIGDFTTETKARRAGIAFVRTWLRSKKSVEACACTKIDEL